MVFLRVLLFFLYSCLILSFKMPSFSRKFTNLAISFSLLAFSNHGPWSLTIAARAFRESLNVWNKRLDSFRTVVIRIHCRLVGQTVIHIRLIELLRWWSFGFAHLLSLLCIEIQTSAPILNLLFVWLLCFVCNLIRLLVSKQLQRQRIFHFYLCVSLYFKLSA